MDNKNLMKKQIGDLSEEAYEVQRALEKARCLVGDISQEYFDIYDPNAEGDRDTILGLFDDYRLKADIVADYLALSYKVIENVVNELEKQYDLLRQEV